MPAALHVKVSCISATCLRGQVVHSVICALRHMFEQLTRQNQCALCSRCAHTVASPLVA